MITSLTDMDMAAMEQLAVSLGQPPFRGRQLFRWVHHRLETDLNRMSSLPREFLLSLASRLQPARAQLVDELVSSEGSTRKRLLALADGRMVEAVLIASTPVRGDADRRTVCVSSQVGCALGCAFCATGQVGFERNLSPGEIVEQVYHFERELRRPQVGAESGGSLSGPSPNGAATAKEAPSPGQRPRLDRSRRPRQAPDTEIDHFVSNVVFMGMGEPLANYEAVLAAIRLLLSPEGFGFGARRVTVSTAGLVPGIERLASEGLQIGLAISLHAADDRLRSRLMPINRRYPVAQLVQAADHYSTTTGRRVTYEYALMEGVNDGVHHARDLARLLAGRLCHVNLIPLNPSLDPSLVPSSPQRVARFRSALEEASIPCTLRQSKGQDIQAACGQLRAGKMRQVMGDEPSRSTRR